MNYKKLVMDVISILTGDFHLRLEVEYSWFSPRRVAIAVVGSTYEIRVALIPAYYVYMVR